MLNPAALVLMGACVTASYAAETGTLRAGAARVDITPAADAALPLSGFSGRKAGFTGIHDRLHARAIVLDDGTAQAAIVACEIIGITNAMWEDLSARIPKETGIPAERIMVAGVHTHGAPSLRGGYTEVGPKSAEYTAKVEGAVVEAIRQAKANLQPARVGAGIGRAYLNINRRELTHRGWYLGYNPDFPSDKTVAVVKFEHLSGEPIALFVNYAVHGVVMGGKNLQVTSDLPGATSRFVEQKFGDKAPVLWTSGAAGDQNPVCEGASTDFTLVSAFGQVLGEEVVRIARKIRTSPRARIRAAQRVITCPGQRVDPGPRPRKQYTFSDADPVNIRISLLVLNEVAFAGVSGEVLTMIGQRLKRESPFTNTIMVTHTNGSSGYIPDDAAYDQVSYEIWTTHLKRGCAEGAIVGGFLDMLNGN